MRHLHTSNIEIYGNGYFKSSVTPGTSVQVFQYVENHAKGCSYHNWTIFGSNSTAVTLYNHSDYVTVYTTYMYEDDSSSGDDSIEDIDETLRDMFHDFPETYDYILASNKGEKIVVDDEIILAFDVARNIIENIPNFFSILTNVIEKENIRPTTLEN